VDCRRLDSACNCSDCLISSTTTSTYRCGVSTLITRRSLAASEAYPYKPVRQDPAFEVLPKSPLDVGWNRVVIGAGFTVCGQVALKMLLDQPVEHRLIGAATNV
jgi:hypothetical protein